MNYITRQYQLIGSVSGETIFSDFESAKESLEQNSDNTLVSKKQSCALMEMTNGVYTKAFQFNKGELVEDSVALTPFRLLDSESVDLVKLIKFEDTVDTVTADFSRGETGVYKVTVAPAFSQAADIAMSQLKEQAKTLGKELPCVDYDWSQAISGNTPVDHKVFMLFLHDCETGKPISFAEVHLQISEGCSTFNKNKKKSDANLPKLSLNLVCSFVLPEYEDVEVSKLLGLGIRSMLNGAFDSNKNNYAALHERFGRINLQVNAFEKNIHDLEFAEIASDRMNMTLCFSLMEMNLEINDAKLMIF